MLSFLASIFQRDRFQILIRAFLCFNADKGLGGYLHLKGTMRLWVTLNFSPLNTLRKVKLRGIDSERNCLKFKPRKMLSTSRSVNTHSVNKNVSLLLETPAPLFSNYFIGSASCCNSLRSSPLKTVWKPPVYHYLERHAGVCIVCISWKTYR